jgi:hypothetical protein
MNRESNLASAYAKAKREGSRPEEDIRRETEAPEKAAAFLNPKNPDRDKNIAAFKTYVEKRAERWGVGASELVEQILNPKSEEDNDPGSDKFAQFSSYLDSFRRDWEKAEQFAEKRLTKDMVERISDTGGRFSTYAGAFGTETLIKSWKDRVPRLMAEDPEKFDNLQNAVEQFEEADRNTTRHAKERAEQLRIGGKRYVEIMSIQDPEERVAALRRAMSGRISKWRQAASALTFGNVSPERLASREGKGVKELEADMAVANEHLNTIGELLSDVKEGREDLSGDMRKALLDSIRTQSTPEQASIVNDNEKREGGEGGGDSRTAKAAT